MTDDLAAPTRTREIGGTGDMGEREARFRFAEPIGWRNLYVTMTIGSVMAPTVHPSRDAAQDHSDRFFMEWPEHIRITGDDLVPLPDGGFLPFGQFTLAIPVQVHE